MSNLRYPWGKVGSLDGSINFATGVFRAQLWRGAVYSASHRTVGQLLDAGAELVVSSDVLPLTITDTAAVDTDAIVFPSVVAGPVITVMTVAQVSGPAGGAELDPAAQRLVLYANRSRNLPVTPRGKPIRFRSLNSTRLRLFQT